MGGGGGGGGGIQMLGRCEERCVWGVGGGEWIGLGGGGGGGLVGGWGGGGGILGVYENEG